MILANLVLLIFSSCNPNLHANSVLAPSILIPYLSLVKVTLAFEFTLTALQPLYFILVEFTEYQAAQRQFYFDNDNGSVGYSFFTDVLVIVSLYIPAVLNYITMGALMRARYSRSVSAAAAGGAAVRGYRKHVEEASNTIDSSFN